MRLRHAALKLLPRKIEGYMLVQGSLMHVNEALTSERFLKFVADEAPCGHYFVAEPPPGVIMTAAIGWRVIVPDLPSIEVLADGLWKGYEYLVRPLHGDAIGRAPQIFIKIRNFRGAYDQFVIGKDLNKKEGLFHRMKESAAVLLSAGHEEAMLQEIEKTAASDCWRKVS